MKWEALGYHEEKSEIETRICFSRLYAFQAQMLFGSCFAKLYQWMLESWARLGTVYMDSSCPCHSPDLGRFVSATRAANDAMSTNIGRICQGANLRIPSGSSEIRRHFRQLKQVSKDWEPAWVLVPTLWDAARMMICFFLILNTPPPPLPKYKTILEAFCIR